MYLQTVDLLKCSQLKINKWPSEEYTLTKEIACRQFARKVFLIYFQGDFRPNVFFNCRIIQNCDLSLQLGIIVPLHALTLPEEPIKGVGEYWCEITVRLMGDLLRTSRNTTL